MRMVVTGSDGFIGRHLVEYFSGKNIEVLGISRNESAERDSRIETVAGELEKKEETVKKVKEKIKSADMLVHLAAPTADVNNLNDVEIIQRNTRVSSTVAALALELNVSKLIHLSSMSVYPNVDGRFDETSPINPSGNSDALYGLSKFNAEVILDYELLKSRILISHLRAAMVYGPGMNESRIIPVLTREKSEKGTLTVFGNGERMLNLISVMKLVLIIELFVRKDLQGVYNVGDEYVSLLEIARRINSDGKGAIVMVEKGSKSKFELDFSKLKAVRHV